MSIGYDESYQYLKMAQDEFDSLPSKKTNEAQVACAQMGFLYLNRAINWASRNYETSCFDGAFAQGGSYDRIRLEASAFFEITRQCRTIFRSASSDEISKRCMSWLLRAKNFIVDTQTQEARATNIQYAALPEEQDYSIITKDGKPLRR